MTIKDFEYDSDTSLPDKLKNTNHFNPIDVETFDSDTDNNMNNSVQEVIPGMYFQGFTADYKGNQRRRAQLAQKNRAKATQNYIQKKIKQIEDKDRIERKQEQRKKGADQQLEEKEEISEDTISHRMASININATSRSSSEAANNSSKSEPDLEQESTSSCQRDSRGKKSGKDHRSATAKDKGKGSSRSEARSKSRNSTKIEGESKRQGHDVINRSNKRADRHRRPEDEVSEPKFTAVVDVSDNEIDLALEEEEKIQFKHNLNFKTDRDDAMPAKPLNSRDWKQIFSQKLQERDQARERHRKKERNEV
ncbi:hypothetical protein BGX21_003242 [Mortierella sp. AD011]|nr:hypothetical protein BGX20_003379 [Mortierella sp. AD010]KAF9400902.1 hypothetical protein BGX21_003242 [Mortierella sp. AD011]